MSRPGLVIAAPASGTGKTTVTLALLAALRAGGHRPAAAKSGPDYIDPAFHAAATGQASVNLDAWAMDPASLRARLAALPGGIVLVEAAMGVLDGAAGGGGSAADLAAALGLPVVLVLDVARQSHSAALAPAGLARLRPELALAGVIANRVGSDRHGRLVAGALADAGVPLFGSLPRDPALALPERHLGLVQAGEHPDLPAWLERAGELAAERIDLGALRAAAGPATPPAGPPARLPPPGSRIALARDTAFAFAYPHLLDDWHAAGASLHPFSPLAGEAPDPAADAVVLPGGYPELNAGRLAAAGRFRAGMQALVARGVTIYGECGGYMVLGEALVDAGGNRHAMLGLLPVSTSFAARRLHLGYRKLRHDGALPWPRELAGHEFHYASTLHEGDGPPLFEARDAEGNPLPPMGRRRGTVMGSFAHVIGPAPG